MSAGCIAGFLAWYDSDIKKERIFACFLLAAAFALKIYPALFGLLLLKRRDYKGIGYSLLFGLLLTFPLFCFFNGGFGNIPYLLDNLQRYRGDYFFTDWNLRVIHIFTPGGIEAADKEVFLIIRRCIDVIAIGSTAVSFFSRRDERLMFSVASMLILCPVGAAYYTMLYLAVPFIAAYQNDKCSNFITLCWVLLLTPLRFALDFNDFLFPLLLCAMLIYNLCRQIKNKDFMFNRKGKSDVF